MARPEDALELLLPGSQDVEVQRARKVTHFLRLLSDDAQPRRACSVGIDLPFFQNFSNVFSSN